MIAAVVAISVLIPAFPQADLPRSSGELDDVQTSTHAIPAIQETAVVHVAVVAGDVKRRERHSVDHRGAWLGERVHRCDEVRYFDRMVGIPNVGYAKTRIEPRADHQSSIVRIIEVLVHRVHAKPRSTRTEIGA